MKKKKNVVELKRREALEILHELDYLVVSLDRLGSAELSKEGHRLELEDFVQRGKVFRRLARMRATISVALEKTHSRAEQYALEEKAETIKYWKIKRTKTHPETPKSGYET